MFRSSTSGQPKAIKQFKINYICSCLSVCKIRTSKELIDNLDQLIARIKQAPDIFKPAYTPEQCYKLFEKAIQDYNSVNVFNIMFPEYFFQIFKQALNKTNSQSLTPIVTNEDLTKVTKSCDRFSGVAAKKTITSNAIAAIMQQAEFVVCLHVVLGAGDTATTLWLEKYKSFHYAAEKQLSQQQLPGVLMIADGSGSWKHNYTLAQRHSSLERTTSIANPSDYLSNAYYLQNPHANGRHVYQANEISLVKTQAPLLNATVVKIEKKTNHAADWQSANNDYRLIIKTAQGVKPAYTNDLSICTGLGPAKNAIAGTLISHAQFTQLSQFDSEKKFTPIVDGNQFILTNSEEQCATHRTIVIYGGGGTAAACYRKGFFGHDVHTEGRAFLDENKKNSVIWVAKQFDKAGTGTLAITALGSAKHRKELHTAELVKIESQTNGKLSLTFKKINAASAPTATDLFKIECDQLVYSIGQNDNGMRKVCEEIDADLSLNHDSTGMVLNVATKDKKVTFFGAAAMAVRETAYLASTWKWLHEQNIGGDVGPGSMPPSRAQIKRYTSLQGIAPDSINANMDSNHLIVDYLRHAGVDASIASSFTAALLTARKHSTSGCTHQMLKNLLVAHGLDKILIIQGLGHFVMKKKEVAIPATAALPASSVANKANNHNNTARLFAVISRDEDENSYIRSGANTKAIVHDNDATTTTAKGVKLNVN